MSQGLENLEAEIFNNFVKKGFENIQDNIKSLLKK